MTDYNSEAFELLEEVLEPFDTPCRYDHHGYCQEHFLHEAPCPFGRAKELVKARKDKPANKSVADIVAEADPEANALYIQISEGTVYDTLVFGNSVFVDVDSSGEAVGVEILVGQE